MASSVTMETASVNSGVAVTLNGISVKYVWKNLTNVKPVPGAYATTEADVGGYENPTLTLGGVIDVNSDSTTLELIKDFAKLQFDGTSATAIKLTISAGTDQTVYLKNAASSEDFIYVIVKNFHVIFNTQVKDGSKWLWTVEIVETKVT